MPPRNDGMAKSIRHCEERSSLHAISRLLRRASSQWRYTMDMPSLRGTKQSVFHFTLTVQILVGGGTPTNEKKCYRHFEFPREVSIYNLESPLMRFLRLWRTRSKRRKQHTSLRGTKQAMFVSFPRFLSAQNETIDIILMGRGDTNHGGKSTTRKMRVNSICLLSIPYLFYFV